MTKLKQYLVTTCVVTKKYLDTNELTGECKQQAIYVVSDLISTIIKDNTKLEFCDTNLINRKLADPNFSSRIQFNGFITRLINQSGGWKVVKRRHSAWCF